MYWQPIATAPTNTAWTWLTVSCGPWVKVRDGSNQARARLRLELDIYDIASDSIVHRPAAWWGENDAPLDFSPTEWSEDLG